MSINDFSVHYSMGSMPSASYVAQWIPPSSSTTDSDQQQQQSFAVTCGTGAFGMTGFEDNTVSASQQLANLQLPRATTGSSNNTGGPQESKPVSSHSGVSSSSATDSNAAILRRATTNLETGGLAKTKTQTSDLLQDESAWVFTRSLGRGAFGTVDLGYRKSDPTQSLFAVKTAYRSEESMTEIATLKHEVDFLLQVGGSSVENGIVQLLGFERFEPSSVGGKAGARAVLENCEGGSLSDLIKSTKTGGTGSGGLAEAHAKELMYHMLTSLSQLHGLGIVHRDIKPGNVLLVPVCDHEENDEEKKKKKQQQQQQHNRSDSTPVAHMLPKLADFGSSASVIGNDGDTVVGTILFLAPEAFEASTTAAGADTAAVAGPAHDIWSLGCVLVQMLTGEAPWSRQVPLSGLHQRGAFFKMKEFLETNKDVQPDLGSSSSSSNSVSESCRDFLSKIFVSDPNRRWTAAHLLQHPWFHAALSSSRIEAAKRTLLLRQRRMILHAAAVSRTLPLQSRDFIILGRLLEPVHGDVEVVLADLEELINHAKDPSQAGNYSPPSSTTATTDSIDMQQKQQLFFRGIHVSKRGFFVSVAAGKEHEVSATTTTAQQDAKIYCRSSAFLEACLLQPKNAFWWHTHAREVVEMNQTLEQQQDPPPSKKQKKQKQKKSAAAAAAANRLVSLLKKHGGGGDQQASSALESWARATDAEPTAAVYWINTGCALHDFAAAAKRDSEPPLRLDGVVVQRALVHDDSSSSGSWSSDDDDDDGSSSSDGDYDDDENDQGQQHRHAPICESSVDSDEWSDSKSSSSSSSSSGSDDAHRTRHAMHQGPGGAKFSQLAQSHATLQRRREQQQQQQQRLLQQQRVMHGGRAQQFSQLQAEDPAHHHQQHAPPPDHRFQHRAVMHQGRANRFSQLSRARSGDDDDWNDGDNNQPRFAHKMVRPGEMQQLPHQKQQHQDIFARGYRQPSPSAEQDEEKKKQGAIGGWKKQKAAKQQQQQQQQQHQDHHHQPPSPLQRVNVHRLSVNMGRIDLTAREEEHPTGIGGWKQKKKKAATAKQKKQHQQLPPLQRGLVRSSSMMMDCIDSAAVAAVVDSDDPEKTPIFEAQRTTELQMGMVNEESLVTADFQLDALVGASNSNNGHRRTGSGDLVGVQSLSLPSGGGRVFNSASLDTEDRKNLVLQPSSQQQQDDVSDADDVSLPSRVQRSNRSGEYKVLVRNELRSVQDCFLEAVRADARTSAGWLNLALCLQKNSFHKMFLSGKTSSASSNSSSSSNNDSAVSVSVGGREFDAKQAFVQACVTDFRNAEGWLNLFKILAEEQRLETTDKSSSSIPSPSVIVRGRSYDATACLVRSLEENENSLPAWESLQRLLLQVGDFSRIVSIRGRKTDLGDCSKMVSKLRMQNKKKKK